MLLISGQFTAYATGSDGAALTWNHVPCRRMSVTHRGRTTRRWYPVAGDQPYRPAYERAVEQLIAFIADRDLRPGDRLPTEMQLARELGASHRAVREAVKMLTAIGRVRAERGRGIFVGDDRSLLTGERPVSFRPTDLDHIAMLFEFRSVQESETARLASQRATPSEVRAIAAAIGEGEQAANENNPRAFIAADDGFHSALAEASHNIFLIDAVAHVRSLQRQVSLLELGTNVRNADRANKEHGSILEAIRGGDSTSAAERAADHVRKSLQDYRDIIERKLLMTAAID
jgi:GntR family transcriptional repressor for pyruvate dehydrogenase complex